MFAATSKCGVHWDVLSSRNPELFQQLRGAIGPDLIGLALSGFVCCSSQCVSVTPHSCIVRWHCQAVACAAAGTLVSQSHVAFLVDPPHPVTPLKTESLVKVCVPQELLQSMSRRPLYPQFLR
jgi:hypothetical protein